MQINTNYSKGFQETGIKTKEEIKDNILDIKDNVEIGQNSDKPDVNMAVFGLCTFGSGVGVGSFVANTALNMVMNSRFWSSGAECLEFALSNTILATGAVACGCIGLLAGMVLGGSACIFISDKIKGH